VRWAAAGSFCQRAVFGNAAEIPQGFDGFQAACRTLFDVGYRISGSFRLMP